MEASAARWAADAARRVVDLEAAHATGRRALEADIAAHPLEPQLSRAVADAVAAEDAAGRALNVRLLLRCRCCAAAARLSVRDAAH
jgi:hypothetical protein